MPVNLLEIYKHVDGFLDGHFVLASGLHSNIYINKNAVYPYTNKISEICYDIAKKFINKNINVVVGPATGGIILSQWIAHHLSSLESTCVLSAYADKDGDNFVIKRGYDNIINGRNILVVEDLVTTGGSLLKVVNETRRVGGRVVAAVAVINRGNVTANQVGNPDEFVSMLNIDVKQWTKDECYLCNNNIAINTNVGHYKMELN